MIAYGRSRLYGIDVSQLEKVARQGSLEGHY